MMRNATDRQTDRQTDRWPLAIYTESFVWSVSVIVIAFCEYICWAGCDTFYLGAAFRSHNCLRVAFNEYQDIESLNAHISLPLVCGGRRVKLQIRVTLWTAREPNAAGVYPGRLSVERLHSRLRMILLNVILTSLDLTANRREIKMRKEPTALLFVFIMHHNMNIDFTIGRSNVCFGNRNRYDNCEGCVALKRSHLINW